MTARSYFKAFEIDVLENNPSVDWSSDPTSYNTPKTTLDPNAGVDGVIKTYRWVDQIIQSDLNAFPSLISVTTNPPKIEPGKSIGLRSTGSAKIGDVITNDTFELPESMDDRRITGSANRKFLARNYLINRPCRVITGTDPKDYSNALVENYYISDFVIAKNGAITFNFVDPLYFTNEEKAKIPVQTNATLVSDILATDPIFNIVDPDGIFEVGDTGLIRQASEIYSYEVTNTNELTTARGRLGTTPSDHSAGDTVQKVTYYENVNVIDIFIDIFENYTTIDPAFIPYAKWNELKAGDLFDFNLKNYISKPTSVKEILGQLIEITGVSMFFDVELQEITIIATPRFTEPAATFTDELNIEQGSCKVTPSFKNKITRQQINWGKTNYTEGDDDQYFANGFIVIDGSEEDEYHAAQEFAAKTVKTNWLEKNSAEDAQIATRVPQLNVSRFSQTPNLIEFNTDVSFIGGAGDSRVWLGSVINIETGQNLGADLTREPLIAQITGITPKEMNLFFIQALSYKGNVLPSVDLYINATTQDLVISDELSPSEAKEYVVVINNGVDIGATSTSEYSLDTGAFPVGSSLKLIILGRVLGAGGDGAATDEAVGGDGGTAINIQIDTEIDNLSGFIGGGGGGGGSGLTTIDVFGGGGGGGQGFAPGQGGFAVNPGDDGTITNPGNGGYSETGVSGVAGGSFGENGIDTVDSDGGTAGLAIQTNGNAVTITAGNNTAQIKGLIV